ncbi:MAG: hypothetical protein M3Q58_04170 [Bacteroidota bacterium]|nr:hypothetical protein [Bacteroidota bacterium]
MKIRSKILFLLTTLLIVSITSCVKKVDYPIEPIIKFEEFKRFNNDSAWFIFSFTDGDGDIGFRKGDTIAPFLGDYAYNFYMDYYEKQNGEFVKNELIPPFFYRIPDVTPDGKNKSIEGEVIVRMKFYFDPSSANDTIKYSAFIYDRSHNKSNIIETQEIIVVK